MEATVMLTTIDNPYDPFEQFALWYMFDLEKGYDCSSRIARLANFSDDMSEEEVNAENERVIDEIIKHDPINVFVKRWQKGFEPKNNLVTEG